MTDNNLLWKPDEATKVALTKLYGCKPKKKRYGLMADKKWRRTRRIILKAYGRICMRCGSTKKIQVDHIKPKFFFPELMYSFENLQVLCEKCNSWKGTRTIDYRKANETPMNCLKGGLQ